jgi:hypothetical protein
MARDTSLGLRETPTRFSSSFILMEETFAGLNAL